MTKKEIMKSLLSVSLILMATACSLSSGEQAATARVALNDVSTFCVMRHAEAYKNLANPPEGLSAEELDSLTEEGLEQARTVAEQLPQGIVRVYASPTGRTTQSAAVVVESYRDEDLEVQEREELRELGGDIPWQQRMDNWDAGEDPSPEGGDSLIEGMARLRPLLAEAQDGLSAGEHALLVTHGDIASMLVGALLATPPLQSPRQHEMTNGEVACVELPGRGRPIASEPALRIQP